jgi:hypothetical protein
MAARMEEWAKGHPIQANVLSNAIFAFLYWLAQKWLAGLQMETYLFGACIFLITTLIYIWTGRENEKDAKRFIADLGLKVDREGNVYIADGKVSGINPEAARWLRRNGAPLTGERDLV